MPSPIQFEGPQACHKEASPHTPRSPPEVIFHDDPTPWLIPRMRGRPRRHPATGPRLPCSPGPWTVGGHYLELMFPVSIMRPAGRRDLSMPSPVPLEGPPACHKEASPHTPQASPESSSTTTRLPGSSRGREGDRVGIQRRGQGFRVPRDPGLREGMIWNLCFFLYYAAHRPPGPLHAERGSA